MHLTTDRLALIHVSMDYVQDIFENYNSRVATYTSPRVAKSIRETRKVVKKFIKQQKKNTDYVYAITLQNTGEFIGIVGLHSMDKPIPELGIWTKISSHGNHYGREAIGGIIEYARSLGIHKLRYPVDRRNIASVKIPQYYGGMKVIDCHQDKCADGRILEIETYEIEL